MAVGDHQLGVGEPLAGVVREPPEPVAAGDEVRLPLD